MTVPHLPKAHVSLYRNNPDSKKRRLTARQQYRHLCPAEWTGE